MLERLSFVKGDSIMGVTQFVSRGVALALLAFVNGSAPHSRQWVRDAIQGLAEDARAARPVTPWFIADGCKVGAVKRGSRVRFYVSGYAHDGSDVRACLARLSPASK